MEKKSLGTLVSDAGKSASAFLEKTKNTVVKTVDQNDDGSFDMKDVSAIAESIGTAAKNTAAAVKESAELRSLEMDRRVLQPVFAGDIEGADFIMPKLIRVTEIDKKRAESVACQGSIGYKSTEKELPVLNIFTDKVDMFGISLYPNAENDVYYIDPCDRDNYIALDEYFSYLKIVRVNELQEIARDLGAKHFRVVYREQNASKSKDTVKAKASVKKAGSVDIDSDHSSIEKESVEIAAESSFPGKTPDKPILKYWQKDPTIQKLIELRMDTSSPCTHQKFVLNLSNTSGIKEKDAVKIDGAIKAMKISARTSVASEAFKETHRFLEYEIDF